MPRHTNQQSASSSVNQSSNFGHDHIDCVFGRLSDISLCIMPLQSALASLATLFALSATAHALPECVVTIQGILYDLSPLTRHVDAPYTVQDPRDAHTNYTFNICDDVDSTSLPAHLHFIPDETSVPAFQIQAQPQVAYQLSRKAELGWNFTLLGAGDRSLALRHKHSLMCTDTDRAARGIVLEYSGGASDWCPSASGSPVSRALRVAIECDARSNSDSLAFQDVVETQDCHYEVYAKSVYGCPVSCRSGSAPSPSVCGGRGVCGFDASSEAAYCICDNGYTGSHCSKGMCRMRAWSAAGKASRVAAQLSLSRRTNVGSQLKEFSC